ncbi:Clavaminate synthase-like protein [Marasmius fiardii PR-910]|nr:Clavaminate synthase-like protein [Marasmius fiardii PR-910]
MSTSTVTQVAEELSSKLNLNGASPDLPKWEAPKTTEQEVEWADILTVDLSLYGTKKQELIDTIQTALERDGFFYVVNHGIPQETLQRQFDIGQYTFDGVSREEKEKHVAPIKEKGSFIGYKLQNYWEIKDGVRDRIEHYNFYQNHIDPIARHPKPLQPFVGEAKAFLTDIRQKVLRRILNLIDGVLGLEEGYLFSLHEDDKGRTGDDLLRYMIYDPLSSEESQKTKGVMLNGHTDFNSLSTLVSQPITALQVLMPDNVWRYVKHRDGALVINIGDQLSFMSGGILKGTMHRVVSPPEDQRHYRRLGVFHFAQFINGISLNLLPSKKVRENGHVIFHNEVPTTDQWEAMRVKNYGTAKFIKGEEYDIEEIAGIQLRHYH